MTVIFADKKIFLILQKKFALRTRINIIFSYCEKNYFFEKKLAHGLREYYF